MQIQLDANLYGPQLEELFKESLNQAGIKSRTGSLYNSFKILKREDETGTTFALSFNEYGILLDEGVQGRLGGSTGQGFAGLNFAFTKSPKSPPKRPPYTGYGLGIKARPWVANFLAQIEARVIPGIGDSVFQQVDNVVKNSFSGLQSVEINTSL
jgi:hypothetical protein